MNLQSKSLRASDCGKLFPKSPLQYFPENNGENIWLMENHFARAATYISRIFRIPLPTPWELNFISISSLVTTEKMSPNHSIKVSRAICNQFRIPLFIPCMKGFLNMNRVPLIPPSPKALLLLENDYTTFDFCNSAS